MNERIKELAKLAGALEVKSVTNIPKALSLNGEEIQEFAELIVRECLDQLLVSDPTEDFDKGIAWSAKQIKQHFGVEE